MAPAPKKPMPETTCAARRAGSEPAAALMLTERIIARQEPNTRIICVRKPAGWLSRSRSKPIAPPSSMETAKRKSISPVDIIEILASILNHKSRDEHSRLASPALIRNCNMLR